VFFEKSVEEIVVSLKSDNNSRYFIWRSSIFFIISRSVLLRIRTVSDFSSAGLTIVKAGSMHRRERKRIQDFWFEKLKEREQLEWAILAQM
jgi:hypothetical protein